MSFTLNQVVPWGRSFDEYVAMFALTDADLGHSILGCGDGPASFHAALTRRGGRVVSVDPLYRFAPDDIRERIRQTSAEVLEQTRRNVTEFVWTSIRSVEELGPTSVAALTWSSPPLRLRAYRSRGFVQFRLKQDKISLVFCVCGTV